MCVGVSRVSVEGFKLCFYVVYLSFYTSLRLFRLPFLLIHFPPYSLSLLKGFKALTQAKYVIFWTK